MTVDENSSYDKIIDLLQRKLLKDLDSEKIDRNDYRMASRLMTTIHSDYLIKNDRFQ